MMAEMMLFMNVPRNRGCSSNSCHLELYLKHIWVTTFTGRESRMNRKYLSAETTTASRLVYDSKYHKVRTKGRRDNCWKAFAGVGSGHWDRRADPRMTKGRDEESNGVASGDVVLRRQRCLAQAGARWRRRL